MNNKNGEWYKKTTGYIWKFIRYIWKCMNGRKWYSLLLLLSSLYVWKYRFEINQLKELNAKNIIFILWIFLLAFPLFSEMEILGIKVKKEVEKATEEVKESLKNIQTQIIQLQMNNSDSYIYKNGDILEVKHNNTTGVDLEIIIRFTDIKYGEYYIS